MVEDIALCAEDSVFVSRVGQIGYSIAHASPPLLVCFFFAQIFRTFVRNYSKNFGHFIFAVIRHS